MSGPPKKKMRVLDLLRDPFGPGRRARRSRFSADFLSGRHPAEPEMPLAELKRIVFFNHFHNGDIHLARGIVREIVRALTGATFLYSHACPSDLLADMPSIDHDSALFKQLRNNKPYLVDRSSGTVFINTWIGCLGTQTVEATGGCNILLLHEILAASVRRSLGLVLPPVTECMPAPDFSNFHIQSINAFMQNDARVKILISNGKVLSQQSTDFDFAPFILALAEKFPSILFVPSNPTGLNRPNIIHSADIIQKNAPDLNENGYLSTFCSAVIGRSSGSYSFSIHRRNLGSRKIFLSFCHCPLEASLGFDEPVFQTRCSFIATNDFRPEFMLRRMIRVVEIAAAGCACMDATVETADSSPVPV